MQCKSRSVSFENVIVEVEPKFVFHTQQFYSGLLSLCLIASALPSEFQFSYFPVLSTTLFFYISDKLDSVRDHFESCIW